MRRQRADHDCGPTALANALERFGIRRGLATVAKLCGTTLEGSDETDLMRGALALACGVDEHAGDGERESRAWLASTLAAGRPALLCIDRWGHWVTAIGACGADVVIYDPARETGGAAVLRWRSLRRRWEAARRVRRASGANGVKFYALGIGAPPTAHRALHAPTCPC